MQSKSPTVQSVQTTKPNKPIASMTPKFNMNIDVLAPSKTASTVSWDKNYKRGSNNNPTNIKLGALTQKWIDSGKATVDPTEALDGGHFLKFKYLSDGLDAVKDLLTDKNYADLPVDRAMSKWSAGSYDAAELGLPHLGAKKISELTPNELSALVEKMAHYESGYRVNESKGPTSAGGGGR